jgi:hypothetical protein
MMEFGGTSNRWRRALGGLVVIAALLIPVAGERGMAGADGMDGTILPGEETADGGGLSPLIARAERIDTFAVEGAFEPSSETGPDFVGGYRWTTRGAALDPGSARELIGLVFDERSYVFGKAKKCPFIPEYALRFHRGAESAELLLSFSCQRWAFVWNDTRRIENFDPVNDRLKEILRTVFRTD